MPQVQADEFEQYVRKKPAGDDWERYARKPQPSQPASSLDLHSIEDQVFGRSVSIPMRNSQGLITLPREVKPLSRAESIATAPLDFFAGGAQQFGRGLVRLGNPANRDDFAGGASDLFRGGLTLASPFAVPSLIAAPGRALVGMGTGLAAGRGTEAGLRSIGAPPGFSSLASDLAGSAAGLGASHIPTERIPFGRLIPGPFRGVTPSSQPSPSPVTPARNPNGRSASQIISDLVGLVSPRAGKFVDLVRDATGRFSAPSVEPPKPATPPITPPAAPQRGLAFSRELPDTGTAPRPLVPLGGSTPSAPEPSGTPATGTPLGLFSKTEPAVPSIPRPTEGNASPAATESKPSGGILARRAELATESPKLSGREATAYQNSLREAGFKTDPGSYPGAKPGVSMAESFTKNARGQVAPLSVRTFPEGQLPALSAKEGLSVDAARARLKAAGWLVKAQ